MTDKDVAGFFLEGWYVFDNFAAYQVEWRGKLYPTAEHAYQAAHFIETDQAFAEKIRLARSPREASDTANANAQHEDPNWPDKRLAIMEEILRAKLEQHNYIRQMLLKTADARIVEMNDQDAFWGWGQDHAGRNEMGKIWMRLRDELAAS